MCNAPITNSVHAWYCPKCREIAYKEKIARSEKMRKIKRRLRNDYKYNKNYGIVEFSPKHIRQQNFSPASLRWANMPWGELTSELARYHMTYGESQTMAYSNTLPENFGLKRKRKARCK